jgi:hypothetical protein
VIDMRDSLVVKAIGNIGFDGRREVVSRNEATQLVQGKKLNQLELEVAFAYRYDGRADLFPERYPETNGAITIEESQKFWGDLWEVVEPMINSDSPKWSEVNASGVRRKLIRG